MTNPYSNEENGSESNKLLYDFFKHLTTLNTGSILIIITFWQNDYVLSGLEVIVLSLFGFISSLICSVLSMYAIADPIKHQKFNSIVIFTRFLSWICFLSGVTLLTCLAIYQIIGIN